MEALDRLEAKIQTMRSWVQKHPLSSVLDHQFIAAAPLREAELAQIEREYGVELPPEYRAFLRRCGDVDFGPGNVFNRVRDGLTSASQRPFPLTTPFLGCCSPAHLQLSPEAQWEQYHFLLKDWEAIPGNEGVLSLCDYGCAIEARLILVGEYRDRVWILQGDAAYYGPFGGSESLHDESSHEWQPTEAPRDYSFFEWYESWLDGQLSLAAR